MSFYSYDQFNIFRYHPDNGLVKIVLQIESSSDYQDLVNWRNTQGNVLVYIESSFDESNLPAYRLDKKIELSNFIDKVVSDITLGIPDSEIKSFEAKVVDAKNYLFLGIDIPENSSVNFEIQGTGETKQVICEAIIERFTQRNYVVGNLSSIRRKTGWAFEEANSITEINAIYDASITMIRTRFNL